MPARNTIKTYVADGYYHAYNRGAGKQAIFLEDNDYVMFLYLLKSYLSPQESFIPSGILNKSLHDQVKLLCFCLMPNHFHLLLKQVNADGMTRFFRKIGTAYSMYFNNKYQRSGTLFQGRYKAVLVDNERQLIHLSRYIHCNPLALVESDLIEYPYSSLSYYSGDKKAVWLDTKFILGLFESKRSLIEKKFINYEEFVKSNIDSKEVLGSLTLE